MFASFLELFVGLGVIKAVEVSQPQAVQGHRVIFPDVTGSLQILNGKVQFLHLTIAIASVQIPFEQRGVVVEIFNGAAVVVDGFLFRSVR